MTGLAWWTHDSWEMVRRNLIHIKRTPELLLDVTLSPIMFVLLFSVVFGGAINVGAEGGEDASYTNFLMAGIFVQTVAFAGIYTSVLLANDLQKGMIDRFRSLPMAQSSVLTGRTLTDLLRAALAVAIMWVVGLVVGFRPEGGLAANSLAIGIMLLFGFALSWVGRRRRRAGSHARGVAGYHLRRRLPAHLREQRLRPGRLRCRSGSSGSRTNQPFSVVVNAVRDLTLGTDLYNDTVPAILWSVGIFIVAFPLGLWLYNRRTTAVAAQRADHRLRRRLPELEAVALRVGPPAESTDAVHGLDIVVDVDAAGSQLAEHRVEVAHPEVDHPGLLGAPEVVGIGRERRPDGRPLGLPPGRIGLLAVGVDAEVLLVPASQRGGIA